MRRCIYHTDLGQNAVFHNSVFKTNCTQSIFRTINRGLLAKPFKKFPKSPIRQPVLISTASYQCGQVFNRDTLQHNHEFIIIIFCYLMVSVITMCNLIKRLIRATFLSTPASDVHERWKQKGTDKRLKLQERLLTINERNIIRWNIYRDTNFHSRRQVLKCL